MGLSGMKGVMQDNGRMCEEGRGAERMQEDRQTGGEVWLLNNSQRLREKEGDHLGNQEADRKMSKIRRILKR
jgi:hypothetical protein